VAVDQDNKLKLISKEESMNSKYDKIANSFHKLGTLLNLPSKIPALPKEFTES